MSHQFVIYQFAKSFLQQWLAGCVKLRLHRSGGCSVAVDYVLCGVSYMPQQTLGMVPKAPVVIKYPSKIWVERSNDAVPRATPGRI
jgi:hypothetical protein